MNIKEIKTDESGGQVIKIDLEVKDRLLFEIQTPSGPLKFQIEAAGLLWSWVQFFESERVTTLNNKKGLKTGKGEGLAIYITKDEFQLV